MNNQDYSAIIAQQKRQLDDLAWRLSLLEAGRNGTIVSGPNVVFNGTPYMDNAVITQPTENGVPMAVDMSAFTVAMKSPTGWLNRTGNTLSYNPTTRILTATPTSPAAAFDYYLNGSKRTSAGITWAAHPASVGGHYFKIDQDDNPQTAASIWDIMSEMPTLFVYWKSASKYLPLEERHGANRVSLAWHRADHFKRGTYWYSGFGMSGAEAAPSSPTNAKNQPAIAAGRMFDEDLPHDIAALAAGSYNQFYREATTTDWTWDTAQSTIAHVGASYICYNNASGGWTELTSGQYMCVYLMVLPSLLAGTEHMFLSGQAAYAGTPAGLAQAQAESPASISWGTNGFPVTECLFAYKFILEVNSGWGTTGKFRIKQIDPLLSASLQTILNVQTTLNATSGTVGGFSIGSQTLSGGGVTLDSTGQIAAGSGDDLAVMSGADALYRLWAGAAAAASAPFSVTKAGVMKATAGSILGLLQLGSGSPYVHIDGTNKRIESSNFASGVSGFRMGSDGNAEFNNVTARGEIQTSVLKYNQIHASNGTLGVFKAAGKLRTDFTSVASPTTFTVDIDEVGALFAVNDILLVKNAGGTANWLKVTAVSNQTTFYRYTCTLENGTASTAFAAGSAVVDYGVSGDGFLIMTADDTNAPFYSVRTHAGSPWSAQTEIIRLGNLDGISGLSSYGMATLDSNGNVQTVITNEGILTTGDGQVEIDQYGISILGSNSVSWYDGDGEYLGGIDADIDGTGLRGDFSIEVNPASKAKALARIQVDASTYGEIYLATNIGSHLAYLHLKNDGTYGYVQMQGTRGFYAQADANSPIAPGSGYISLGPRSDGWYQRRYGSSAERMLAELDLPCYAAWFADEMLWYASGGGALSLTTVFNATQPFGMAWYVAPASANDGDYAVIGRMLAAGTYTLTLNNIKNSVYGKIDIYLDTTKQNQSGALDMYAATLTYNNVVTQTITVPTGGYHTITLKINGKNASSTDYVMAITRAVLTPSAY